MVWLKFIICLSVIIVAGSKLAKYGDILSDKTGLGRAWVGMVLLAAVTSLPELATGVSSVAIVDRPNLTVGDLFGANMFNLAAIAIIDIVYRSGPVLRYVGTSIILSTAGGIFIIAMSAAFLYLAHNNMQFSLFNYIGIYSPVLLLLYLAMQYILFRFARKQPLEKSAQPSVGNQFNSRKVYVYFALAAVAVIASGTWLAFIGEEIAGVTGIRYSVVGTLFLALATTAPELTVSISAIRLGFPDLAVGNLVGSSLFNMGVVIFVDDLFYTKGPLLSAVSTEHIFTAFVAVMMSCIVIITLIFRPNQPFRRIWIGVDAILLLILFIGAYIVLFNLGQTS